MEGFLLEIDERFVHVLIEDERGPDGAVPTLVSGGAPSVSVVPTRYDPPLDPPPPDPPGTVRYPPFPQALFARLEQDPSAALVGELRLNVSELPMGIVPFSLGEFAQQAANAVDSGTSAVRLDTDAAWEWGVQLRDEQRAFEEEEA